MSLFSASAKCCHSHLGASDPLGLVPGFSIFMYVYRAVYPTPGWSARALVYNALSRGTRHRPTTYAYSEGLSPTLSLIKKTSMLQYLQYEKKHRAGLFAIKCSLSIFEGISNRKLLTFIYMKSEDQWNVHVEMILNCVCRFMMSRNNHPMRN